MKKKQYSRCQRLLRDILCILIRSYRFQMNPKNADIVVMINYLNRIT